MIEDDDFHYCSGGPCRGWHEGEEGDFYCKCPVGRKLWEEETGRPWGSEVYE